MNNKVVMMMADGVEEIEATVPFDLMREAGLNVDLVSAQIGTCISLGVVYTITE